MKFGVAVFPGTWSDTDCFHVIKNVFHQEVEYIWHRETDLSSYDCIIIPGGFSYGDYLRCGAMARFSPVMDSIINFVNKGGIVIGICNGFQILCEAGLLPGVLMRNNILQFRCQNVNLRVENNSTIFTNMYKSNQVLQIPISHAQGNYFADKETLYSLENSGQILFKYSEENGSITKESNPNGSLMNIAGIMNSEGNVLGMMPHPERCCEEEIGGTDGSIIFNSIIHSISTGSIR
ncbi:MAG: phosphoribosylformylglycinamidine synthase I [Chloroflexi bacterium]|nr:phosphoribosylformylglycinamidine synthase I [Chloroflexota bacterium]|tara:strand:+ start:272 stop:976 length:705 start_codon:yes stop_codon:yes gene_type:complete